MTFKEYIESLEQLEQIKKDKILSNTGEVVYIPEFISLAGSSVEKEEYDDLDIIIRKRDRDESLEVLLRKHLFKDVQKPVHFVYNETGPHSSYIPIYDLVLRPKSLETYIIEAVLKPIKKFIPAKTKGAYSLQEYYDIETFYTEWAKPLLDKEIPLSVEQKFNGWRCVLEKADSKTLIYFEDSKLDRSKRFPDLVKDLLLIDGNIILDTELGAINNKGLAIDRVDLAFFGTKKTVVPLKFTSPSGVAGRLICHVFDILYYDGNLSAPLVKEIETYRRQHSVGQT